MGIHAYDIAGAMYSAPTVLPLLYHRYPTEARRYRTTAMMM